MKKKYIKRWLNLAQLVKKKSYIVLGPRQTGKSQLIKKLFPNVKKYNLLLKEDFRKLSFDPTLIRKEITSEDKLIIIDEFQRLPDLLDEIHFLIEEHNVHFLLTGSSARKLKKQNINLLGGRARFINLHPFTFTELKKDFNLERAINFGLIPGIYFSDEPQLDLNAYVSTYIEQEIAREGVVRNLTTFTRFLEVASLCHAEQIDFTSISNDAQIPRTTIHEYFKILEDTLVGYMLPVWRETKKRKPIASPKFYFFDWSIPKTILEINNISKKSPLFGKGFESFIFQELKAYSDYHQKELHYWRTYEQDEVDFILDQKIAIEVKSSEVFKMDYLKSLERLKDENLLEKYILIYLGKNLKLKDKPWVEILNYQTFINKYLVKN